MTTPLQPESDQATTATCGTVRSRLLALLDGELSAEETVAVNQHLATCDGCRAARAEIIATLRAAESFPVQTGDITTSVMAQITRRGDDFPVAAPSAPSLTAGIEEMRLLLDEVRALRGELTTVRGEMETLRRQMTALRATSRLPPRPQSPLLFPGSPMADLMGRE